jgi:hypothetical protein
MEFLGRARRLPLSPVPFLIHLFKSFVISLITGRHLSLSSGSCLSKLVEPKEGIAGTAMDSQ